MAIFRLPPFLTVTPGSLPGGPVSYGGYGGRPGAWSSSSSNYVIIVHVPLFKPFLKTAMLVSIICSRTLPDAFPRSMGSLDNSNRLDWPCDSLILLRCAQGDFCLPNNTPLVSMQLQGPFILKTSPHTFLNTKKHIYERLKPYIATIRTEKLKYTFGEVRIWLKAICFGLRLGHGKINVKICFHSQGNSFAYRK